MFRKDVLSLESMNKSADADLCRTPSKTEIERSTEKGPPSKRGCRIDAFSGSDNKRCNEWKSVYTIDYCNGVECKAMIADGVEKLCSIAGMPIQKRMRDQSPKSQMDPREKVAVLSGQIKPNCAQERSE